MGALQDIRVLDLTRVVAGPLATQTLADLGADVIKIERPVDGDDTRRMGAMLTGADGKPTNDSAVFLAANRGKRSVTLDISTVRGRQIVHELARQCDVFVENYKSGTLTRYGLDYAAIAAINPRVVYCSITGFGSDGPYAERPAYDFILQGLSGLMSTCGQPDGAPGAEAMRTAIPVTDIVTGLYATVAILGALHERERSGLGQHVDAAMIDAAVSANGHLAIGYLMTGKTPTRLGNTNPIAAPSEIYATADGEMIVAAGNDAQFKSLLEAIGRLDILADPRFATNAMRCKHRGELRALLGGIFGTGANAAWIDRLSRAGVPCGPVNDMAQVFRDPHVAHRGLHVSVPHGRGVDTPTLKSPLNLSRSPVDYRAAPMLGQHTGEVLGGLLGLGEADLAALREAHVI